MTLVARNLGIALAVASLSAPAYAQAFGVNAGDPVSKYSGKQSLAGKQYYFQISVPQPNGEFESYTAFATPQTGICKVSGLGRNHDDAYGSSLRQSFTRLSNALNERYGTGDQIDFIRTGALWDEPREFIWSIYKDERMLVTYWTPGSGATLPKGLQAVALDTRAVSSSNAYLVLTYEFDNFNRCKQIMESADNQGL